MPRSARTQRLAWLSDRYDRGLTRPLPLTVGYINCGAASWPNDTAKVARILNRSVDHHVDLLLFSEAFNVDAAKVLGDGWAVHHDTSTGAKAGSGVALRKPRGRIKRRKTLLLVTAVLGRRRADRMRDRYGAKVKTKIDPGTPHRWSPGAVALHGPPIRNLFLRAPFLKRATRVKAHIIGGDWNALSHVVRQAFGDDRRVLMEHIDGFVIANWIPVSELTQHDVGSDHLLTVATLWPKS